jgi:hypothetical protein
MFNACTEKQSISNEQSTKFVKFFGGYGANFASDIVDFDGGYALTGTIETSDSMNQAFLIATDKFGNELPWSPVKFGGTNLDYGYKIFRLKSGDFVVVGTQMTALKGADILVVKIGANGVIKWKKTFGGDSDDEGNFGIETSSNDLIIGGYTESFGFGQKDICVYKLSSNGDSLKFAAYGTSSDDVGNDIIEENDFSYIVGFSNGNNNNNRSEIIVIKIDNNNILTGKFLNVNYFGNDTTGLVGLKLKKYTNELLVMGRASKEDQSQTGVYTLKIDAGLNKKWDSIKFSDQGSKLEPHDLLIRNSDFIVIGAFVNTSISSFALSINSEGALINSEYLNSSGFQAAMAGVVSPDGIICIAGVHGGQQLSSQIAIFKGLF